MRKAFAAVAIAVIALLVLSSAALAWTPPGQKGHEGQSGNQGGHHHAGQQGYEGQPGNQGGKWNHLRVSLITNGDSNESPFPLSAVGLSEDAGRQDD